MKIKRILRFYFSAGGLNDYLDLLILKRACDPDGGIEKVTELIYEKSVLERYYGYLDGVFEKLTLRERELLEEYARLRTGIAEGRRRQIKTAVMKFTRRAARLYYYTEAVELIERYWAICPAGSTSSCP